MDYALAALAGASIVGSCLYLDKRVALFILICLACCGGCSYINRQLNFPDDNLFEEIFEDKIEEEFGIVVDLSPESQE